MALRSIGTNYQGNDAKLEASIAAPWYLAWLSRFKSDHPDIPVVVIQAYGFAKASAGVHAGGWCVDFQIWHLTNSQIRTMIKHLRAWGAGATWERNSLDGMDPHIHTTIDSDGADSHSAYQTTAVKNGRNGLVNNARDRYADLNPSRWLTAKQALELLEEALAVTRDEMKLIANYAGTDVWNSTMGSAGTAAQLLRSAANHSENGEAAAVSVWNANLGEAGTAQNLLWRAGVETPNLLKALDARVSAIESAIQKITAHLGV